MSAQRGRGRAQRNISASVQSPSDQSQIVGPGVYPQASQQPQSGRPAGYSSSDSEDDGFEFGSSNWKNKRPESAPIQNKSGKQQSTAHGASGAYFFEPTVISDEMSSTTIASSNNWEGGNTSNMIDTASTADSSANSRSVSSLPSSSVSRSLRGRDAFPTIPQLDESVTTTMTWINKSWNNGFPVNRDSCLAHISVALRKVYQSCPNPFSAGLYFMGFSGDFFTCKQGTLSMQVIVELKKWLLEHGLTEYELTYLNPNIQMIAFNMVTRQRNTQVIKIICEVYRLDKIRNDLLEPLRDLCAGGHYKEACLIATYLGMHTQFDIHDFVVPLLLQDREFVVEEYLAGSKEKQMDLITFLDGMLDENNSSIQSMRDYVQNREISNVKLEKMQTKPLVKLVTRLIDKFKADPINCPNFSRKKRSSALRHLVYRKYDSNSTLNDACFEELVDTTVLEDPILQDEIVYLMRANNDLELAAKFALRHAIPLDRVPTDVQKTMHIINPNVIPQKTEPQIEEEDWECEINPEQSKPVQIQAPFVKAITKTEREKIIPILLDPMNDEYVEIIDDMSQYQVGQPSPSTDYYPISIPSHNIHYVNTPYGIDPFLKSLKAAYLAQKMNGGRRDFLVVSLDAEWKPMMFDKSGVALLQIGVLEDVFLIDTFALKSFKQTPDYATPFWDDIRKQFFANERIVKLGYALDGDINMLANTCPQWQNMREQFKCFLDLNKVYKELVKLNENFFPYSKTGISVGSSASSGLSELVRVSFGKPLSKEEQFSNWENRPLRDAQIQYAAADAYILLELFRFMNKRSVQLNIDFEGTILNILNGPKATVGPKKKKPTTTSVIYKLAKTARFVPDDSPYRNPQLTEDVKFICDNMVQGLGKYLRSCGIDTLILDNDEEHERCTHYAFRDSRSIITRGSAFNQLISQFPELTIYNVINDRLEDQLHDVLAYFNLSICEADIFSRCQKCNCGTFISVSRKTMEYLLLNRNRVMRQSNVVPDAYPSNHDSLIGEITFSTENGHIFKKWNLLPENMINSTDLRNIRTAGGASVIFDKITPNHLEHIEVFIVCDRCGKIYWDGSHMKRIKEGKSVIPNPNKQTLPGPSRNVSGNPKSSGNSQAPRSLSSPSSAVNRGHRNDSEAHSNNMTGKSPQYHDPNSNVSPYSRQASPRRPKSSSSQKE